MTLPISRNTSYSVGVNVAPADLNDLQDCIIANKHPSFELPIAAADFQAEAGGGASLANGKWTFASVSVITAPVRVRAGERITQVQLEYNRGGAGNITLALMRNTGGAVPVVVATTTISAGTGVTTVQFGAAPNYTVAAGEQIYLRVTCDNAAHTIYRAATFVDKL